MSWPLSQDYNEAIQSLESTFSDPDLKRGQAAVNALGIPLPRSGNFADVYEVRGPGGTRWAVKCFTREVAGLRERYQEISKHLRQAQLPFTVEFTFLEQGVRVCGRWYPVLKMQWVEGLTLNEFVRQYADKPAMLEALLQIWVRMAARLRSAGIAHGDLQHGNLLLVPNRATSLAAKLIDYDGMFVPALAGWPSGEVGHPCYQHPQRARDTRYSPEVDLFPFLLIATALCCLKAGGRPLWDKYDSGDNLLFREADLQAPVKSPLFHDLLKLGEPRARRLVERALDALRTDLDRSPLLDELLPELLSSSAVSAAPPALAVTAESIRSVTRRPTTDGRNQRRRAARQRRDRRVKHRLAAVTGCVALIVLLGCSLAWSLGWHFSQSPEGHEAKLSAQVARNERPKSPGGEKPATHLRPRPAGKGSPKPAPTTKADAPKRDQPADKPKPAESAPAKPSMIPLAGQIISNSIGMKLVYVPPGKFLMGTSAAELERYKKLPNKGYDFGWEQEMPQHEVRITKGFFMGVYEVTQGEYKKLIGKNPSAFPESPFHPVDTVMWPDAVEFCRRLSELPQEKKAGRTYRLPTEAEWEYACRAGTTTAFHYGDSLSSAQANFNGASPFGGQAVSKKPSLNKTVKVGSYQPNAFGLYDMHGNVWEWCLDGPRRYTSESVDDPRGPDTSADRVLRGGCWRDGAVRSAYRKPRNASNYRVNICGMRVVCEP